MCRGYVSALMAKLVRHLTCNEKIGGSNPPESLWLVFTRKFKTSGKVPKRSKGLDSSSNAYASRVRIPSLSWMVE